MQKEDWRRVGKMIGYVYLPIVLLVLCIYLLVQYQAMKIENKKTEIEQATRSADSFTENPL